MCAKSHSISNSLYKMAYLHNKTTLCTPHGVLNKPLQKTLYTAPRRCNVERVCRICKKPFPKTYNPMSEASELYLLLT